MSSPSPSPTDLTPLAPADLAAGQEAVSVLRAGGNAQLVARSARAPIWRTDFMRDGNVFALIGASAKALRAFGRDDLATELSMRVSREAHNYFEAIALCLQYVEPVNLDEVDRRARAHEAAASTATNDRARLAAAFATLAPRGYICRADVNACDIGCTTCALAELPEGTTKWVLWSRQRDDAFSDGGNLMETLWLAWGGDGYEIVQALQGAGFTATWSGDNWECVKVEPTDAAFAIGEGKQQRILEEEQAREDEDDDEAERAEFYASKYEGEDEEDA